LRAQSSELVTSFREDREFDLDDFQIAACESLAIGNSVLVAAPTGAGKTVVAEFAVYLCRYKKAGKIFYTTPIKALSNQKYNELGAMWGFDNVGILTGDTTINGEAPIVVMTTEVLRNMIYAQSSSLGKLSFVVLDEVHYLADKFRGAVWEEVLIHLPQHVRTVSLSATVSNAEEFGDWLKSIRGATDVIVSEHRPVPLDQHVLFGQKLVALFDEGQRQGTPRINNEILELSRVATSRAQSRGGRHDNRSRHGRGQDARVTRAFVTQLLGDRNLLPAIFFIFSRIGCDDAVRQLVNSDVRLTSREDRETIRRFVEERCVDIPREDLDALQFDAWLAGLQRGVAAHHAGMLPLFKEIVEELFLRRLVKVVFATETLALGVNMPARTVVLEKLDKFNGEARVQLSPGEYTQLTGRAGRRGIDVEGHSVIQWSNALNPQVVASLASKRTYPMYSSFRPTYNMTINLLARYDLDRARDILQSSFAQFQADRTVVTLAQKVKAQELSLAGYESSLVCHLGDFVEYSALRREITDIERTPLRKSDKQHTRANERAQTIASLRKKMARHACHSCPDREIHARWAERWWRLRRDTDNLIRDINARTGAVSRSFDKHCAVLGELDYTKPHGPSIAPTDWGLQLSRIYGDRDLLVSQCLRQGTWDSLDAASLAALVCALVYQPRRDDGEISVRHLPPGAFRDAFSDTVEQWHELSALEVHHGLTPTDELAPGLSKPMYQWACGARLDDVLFDADIPVGDFVRWTKQTIDLLDQISGTTTPIASVAAIAIDKLRRGVVAYSGQL
jgi:ATP-dependent RNA helicase HelY